MTGAPIVHNADGNPLGPRACDFNVIPLGDTNAHGIPEDFRVEPIPTPVHPEPPRPQAERSRDTHQQEQPHHG